MNRSAADPARRRQAPGGRSRVLLPLRAARLLLVLLLPIGALALVPPARAEDPATSDSLRDTSLPLRTALHHDPTLGSPFDRLLDLYRKADRVEDLVALYQSHLQQYADDLSGRTIHVRLLVATGDPEAERRVRAAVEQHPKSAFLHHLLFSVLDDAGNPHALDMLSKAITLETQPARKRRWVDQFLTQALAEDRLDLAEQHLALLADVLGGGSEAHLSAARKMHDFGLHARALEELSAAHAAKPSPELGVEIGLFAATLEVAMNRRNQAADRLDALLERLTADYWRRPEILRRRARLVSSAEERDAMLAAARERSAAHPDDESIALDLARLLGGFERPRAALTGLHEAAKRMPASLRIEQEILGLYDRLRDEAGRAAYLQARLEEQPTRQDLRERLAQSWFLLGREDRAAEILDALLASLPEDVRISRMLETARFLRTRGLSASAAALYQRVVALAPARLDVRREWAECHLAVGDRGRARRVLSAEIPADVPSDVFIDLVQLLVEQRLYPEARAILTARLETHADDLDVQLTLIHVEAVLGYASSSARRITAARPLADTPARYRRWLEEAISFHRFYDTDLEFLDAEQVRLEGETGWSKARLGRLEAFADVSADAERVEPIAGHLQDLLAGDVAAPVRVRLRRKLAAMLESAGRGAFRSNKAHLGAAAEELRGLIDDDPGNEDEYRARLALIHAAQERLDLARPLLDELDLRKLNDSDILDRLVRVHTEAGNGAGVLLALERLTSVEPTERDHWERWITALVSTGDERTLRRALRRLLRGVPRLRLSRDSRETLLHQLSDSYWRSTAHQIGRRTEAGRLEALALLDEVERLSAADDLPLWVAWTRAFLHNTLGRIEARDEAMGELDRLMQRRLAEATEERARARAAVQAAGERPTPEREADALEEVERIHFPDGLGVSWAAARALLTRTQEPADTTARPEDRRGPERANHVRWAFETAGGDAVSAVVPLDKERLLVSDVRGNVYGLARRSGKVLWQLLGAWNTGFLAGPQQNNQLPPLPTPVPGPGGVFYLPQPGRLHCYGPDGQLRWEGSLRSEQRSTTHLTVVAGAHDVYAYEAGTGEVGCFRAADGRLRWLRTLRGNALSAPTPHGQGIALRGNRLLVYGPRTAVLDAQDGAVLWTFQPDRVRSVPVALDEPDEDVDALFGRRRRKRRSASTAPPPAAAPVSRGPYVSRGRVVYPPPPPGRFPAGFYPGMVFPGGVYPGSIASRLAFNPGLPGGTTFLQTPARSAATWSPKGRHGQTAVLARAVHWATPLPAHQFRLGLLVDSRLVLWRDGVGQAGTALVMDLDLPMFARPFDVSGTPLGVRGKRICLAQSGRLVMWHLDRDARAAFDLGDLAGGQTHYRIQAALDGGFAYVSGPGGVLCASLGGAREVFRAPWPAAAVPEPEEAPSQVVYTCRGVSVIRGQTGYGPLLRPTGFTGDGTFYTVSSEHRVVALDDRPAEPGGEGDKRDR